MLPPVAAPTRRAVLAAFAAGLAGCSASRTPERAAHRPPAATGEAATPGAESTPPRDTPGPAREIVHGPRTRQLVSLTFHGSGDPALARTLLDTAEAHGASITVFAVCSWLEANPSLARRIRDGGHGLANHTYTHPALSALSPAALLAEVSRARDVLQRLTGSDGTYFRPSQMDRATPAVLSAAGAAGYRISLAFDVDPHDYRDPGAAAVQSRTLAGVQPGSVVSLHLGHPGTVQALPGILGGLSQRGLRPVTVHDLLA